MNIIYNYIHILLFIIVTFYNTMTTWKSSIKISIIGDGGNGKTSLINKFVNEFREMILNIKNNCKKRFIKEDFSYIYWDIENVFSLSAKIYCTLIQICPFEEGNKNIIILLSSIPLIMAGYPSLCIHLDFEELYFNTLKEAVSTKDITNLIKLFQEATIFNLKKIKEIIELK